MPKCQVAENPEDSGENRTENCYGNVKTDESIVPISRRIAGRGCIVWLECEITD